MMTDPIADMLARLRNAVIARHDRVNMPHSILKEELAKVLKAEGYVDDVRTEDAEGKEAPRRRHALRPQQGSRHRRSPPSFFARPTPLCPARPHPARPFGHGYLHPLDEPRGDDRPRRTQAAWAASSSARCGDAMTQQATPPWTSSNRASASDRSSSLKGRQGRRDRREGTCALAQDSPEREGHGRVERREGDAHHRRPRRVAPGPRALINGMVQGTASGYTKTLQLVGTGYRAEVKGQFFEPLLGFSTRSTSRFRRASPCRSPVTRREPSSSSPAPTRP